MANKGIDEDGNSFVDDILRIMVLKMPGASFRALAIRHRELEKRDIRLSD